MVIPGTGVFLTIPGGVMRALFFTVVFMSVLSICQSGFSESIESKCFSTVSFNECLASCCESNWMDGLEFFAGLEGSKQPQDFGVNAHMGTRVHVNYGSIIVPEWGLGFQVGTAINASDHAVRVTSRVQGASARTQSFTTFGLFQKSETGWTWGAVYDYLAEDDYDQFSLSQTRGRVSYQMTPDRQVGFYGILPLTNATETWGAVPIELESIAQGSLFYRQTWDNQSETSIWLGMAESHAQNNIALGDQSRTPNVLIYGADFHVPLNSHVALFGEANFITPADTGTVDAYLGFVYYPGGNAYGWRQQRNSPVLPVASNTSFSVDLRR